MDWPQILYVVTTLFSAGAAVLAWIAKLRWSDEYKTATEQIIKSKDAQISLLQGEVQHWKDLNPSALEEWYLATKRTLGEQIASLKDELEKTKKALSESEEKLAKVSNNQRIEVLKAQLDEKTKLSESFDIVFNNLISEIKPVYLLRIPTNGINAKGAADHQSDNLTSSDDAVR